MVYTHVEWFLGAPVWPKNLSYSFHLYGIAYWCTSSCILLIIILAVAMGTYHALLHNE